MIEQGNIKLSVFKEYPYQKLKPIFEFIESEGYECKFAENGNIVFNEIGKEE